MIQTLVEEVEPYLQTRIETESSKKKTLARAVSDVLVSRFGVPRISDELFDLRREIDVTGNLTTQHPTDWENYIESQIREMYDSINSKEDFDEIRGN